MRTLDENSTDTSEIEINEVFYHRGSKWIKLGSNKIAKVFDIEDMEALAEGKPTIH